MYSVKLNLFRNRYLSMFLDVEYDFYKASRKRNVVIAVFFFMLSVWSIKSQGHSSVIIKNIPLDSLRPNRHFGSVKLYSDAIRSASRKHPNECLLCLNCTKFGKTRSWCTRGSLKLFSWMIWFFLLLFAIYKMEYEISCFYWLFFSILVYLEDSLQAVQVQILHPMWVNGLWNQLLSWYVHQPRSSHPWVHSFDRPRDEPIWHKLHSYLLF